MSKKVKQSVADSNKKRDEKAKAKQKDELVGFGVPASLWDIPDESKREKLVEAVAWAVKAAKIKVIKIQSEFDQIKPMYGAERKIPLDVKSTFEKRMNDAKTELQKVCDAQADVHLVAYEAMRKRQPVRAAKSAVEVGDYINPSSPDDTQEKD
jgi:hypothetical protein